MKERCLTVKDAAEILSTSTKSIRRLIDAGKLPAYRIGERGGIRIRESDIAALLVPISRCGRDDLDDFIETAINDDN